jgi:hypothetical protein
MNSTNTSHNCPFEVGKHYLVLKGISFLNHHFKEGTVVVFKDHAYDFHEGVTRFWFSNLNDSETNVWHVFDRDPDALATWKIYFAPTE